MGGVNKAELRWGGRTLLEGWEAKAERCGLEVILIGEAWWSTPEGLQTRPPRELRWIPDQPTGIGPAGGLLAALRFGLRREYVVTVACDMPYVSDVLLKRALTANPGAWALAPPRRGGWEPFLARYRPAETMCKVEALIAAGKRSLSEILRALDCAALTLNREESRQLRDWDCPDDINPLK